MARMVFGQWATGERTIRERMGRTHWRLDDERTACGKAARGLHALRTPLSGPYNRLIIDCKPCVRAYEAVTRS